MFKTKIPFFIEIVYYIRMNLPSNETDIILLYRFTLKRKSLLKIPLNEFKMYIFQCFFTMYTSIQMECQGGVIFVHAPILFCYPKRKIGYMHAVHSPVTKTTQL